MISNLTTIYNLIQNKLRSERQEKERLKENFNIREDLGNNLLYKVT